MSISESAGPLVRRIDHTAVFVSDLERSDAWYEQLLGLSCDTGNDIPGAFFDAGDTILAMLESAETERNLSEQHFAFAVDSAAAVYSNLVSRGHTPGKRSRQLAQRLHPGPALVRHPGSQMVYASSSFSAINPNTLHMVDMHAHVTPQRFQRAVLAGRLWHGMGPDASELDNVRNRWGPAGRLERSVVISDDERSTIFCHNAAPLLGA